MKSAAKFAALDRVVLHLTHHIKHSELRYRQLVCFERARQHMLDVSRRGAQGAHCS